jgi:hypothetical protein
LNALRESKSPAHKAVIATPKTKTLANSGFLRDASF